MNVSRLFALAAVPAVISLTACNGGGGSVFGSNVTGTQAQVRFVNGSPDAGSVDFYLTPTGGTRSTTPSATGIAYGEASSFLAEQTVASQVVVYPTGTSSADVGGICSVPQLSNNNVYTIVLAGSGSGAHCLIFNDAVYAAQPAVRFHDASPNAGSALYFGEAAAPLTIGAQVTALGSQTVPPSGATAFTPVSASAFTQSGAAAFAIGTTESGTTFTATNTLAASAVFAPGSSTSQPNTAGTLPYTTGTFGGPGGVSLFAIDCTATVPTGSTCVAGTTLVGVYDTY
jgi:hypothetical protein